MIGLTCWKRTAKRMNCPWNKVFALCQRIALHKGIKFWIITEADRRSTNVELHISGIMLSLQKC